MVSGLAEELLRSALAAGTFVVISTKALATPGILEVLTQYSDQVSHTVSLSSLSDARNRILEPNAPSAMERLHGRGANGETALYGIEQFARNGIHVTLKADTLFPGVDDTEINITSLLKEGRGAGAKAITLSYAFYRNKFKRKLAGVPLLKDSIATMYESQPIASGSGFSLPLSEKRERLLAMAHVAKDLGFDVISTCRCKNQIGAVPEGSGLRITCHFHDRWF